MRTDNRVEEKDAEWMITAVLRSFIRDGSGQAQVSRPTTRPAARIVRFRSSTLSARNCTRSDSATASARITPNAGFMYKMTVHSRNRFPEFTFRDLLTIPLCS